MSIKLDIYCLNSSCQRIKDGWAREYDDNESQNLEPKESPGLSWPVPRKKKNGGQARKSPVQNEDARLIESGETPQNYTNSDSRRRSSPMTQKGQNKGQSRKRPLQYKDGLPISFKLNQRKATNENFIAVVIAKELFPLYTVAYIRLGTYVLGYDLRRLLRLFYVDLLQDANTDLERAISRILRSQRRSDRVASAVLESCGLVNKNGRADWDDHLEALARSPHWLTTPCFDSSDDEDDTVLLNMSEIKSSMSRSNALRNLVAGLRDCVLPQNLHALSRVMMTIPEDRLWFSAKEDLSISNNIKAFVEQRSEKQWCWWPLRPRMRLLQQDETRMHWRCVSTVNAHLLLYSALTHNII